MRGHGDARLLQVLPGIAEDEREAAAARYIERAGADWAEPSASKALASVMAILASAFRRAVFAEAAGPKSR